MNSLGFSYYIRHIRREWGHRCPPLYPLLIMNKYWKPMMIKRSTKANLSILLILAIMRMQSDVCTLIVFENFYLKLTIYVHHEKQDT